MKSKIDFVEGNTVVSLVKMVLPLLFAMILTMMYNMVDSLWVGNLLGEHGYAALTNSTAVVLVLSAIAMGASNGIAILISQTVGAKDSKKGNQVIITIMGMAFVFSIVVTGLMELLLKPILQAMQTPTEIFQDAYHYLAIYLIGYAAIFLYMQFTSVFRSFGDPMFQMKGMLYTTIVNAILDPVMIHFMGLSGAAWATVISEMLCLAYAFFYHHQKKMFRIQLADFSIHHIKEILQDAIPSALQGCMPAISSATMLVLVSSFGVTTIAAYGVTNKLEILLFYPAMAMNMGLTTIVGQCKGAGRYDRIRDYRKAALVLGGVFTAILSIVVIVTSGQLSMLFVRSDAAAEIVRGFFEIVSVGYVCYMLTSCYLGELCGLGRPGLSMVLMFVYYIVIRIPLAILLVHTPLAINGIWTAILISHVLALVLAAIITFSISHVPYQNRLQSDTL